MERNNTFTTMLEELNYQEMNELRGGSTPGYCKRLQEIANTNLENEDFDWDRWGGEYEKWCMN
ncbi:hypothetical protein SDC9_82749 [bioreactor metagenome]|uniref:Uncharacterized protein n=1 Tax=bioreactor metagenome TaxID=1076179 RepID=A0A644ZE44_9ZZZZ